MRSGQPKQPFPPHKFSFGPNCRTKSKRKSIRHNIISKTALARIAHDSRVHLVTFWNPREQSRPHFSNRPVQRPQPSLMSGRFKRTQRDGSLLKLCSPCGLLSLVLLYLAVLAAAPPLRFRASDVRGDVRDPLWDFGVIVLWDKRAGRIMLSGLLHPYLLFTLADRELTAWLPLFTAWLQ